jgi:DNA-binding PadR family transcriptional regulator
LALAALACLSERPMHPYEIAATLRERHTDDAIKLNYGSLYSVIEALTRHGFIAARETVKAGKRPERTVYALTEAGSLELSDWLSELLSLPVKEYLHFEAGLALMAALAPDEVSALLTRRIDMLEIAIEKARAVLAKTRAKKLARLFTLDREYHVMRLESELAWVRTIAAEVSSQDLEGSKEWHGWYAPGRE